MVSQRNANPQPLAYLSAMTQHICNLPETKNSETLRLCEIDDFQKRKSISTADLHLFLTEKFLAVGE